MNHRLHRVAALGFWGLCLTGLACGAPDSTDTGSEPLGDTAQSFSEFEASTYREPETDVYIVDGDTPMPTRAHLRRFWEKYVQPGALTINTIGSVDDRWGAAAQQNLTYCVSTAFGGNYGLVVQAMAQAAGAWQAASNVRFIHRSDQDGACTDSNANVVFDVRPVSGQPYLARAFFPSYPRAARNVLIDSSSFGNVAPYTVLGILRHELGHVLGFRHEHTRPEAATCFEDSSWRGLTPYDAASVMHYPQCNGTNAGDLVLTTLDRLGAAAVYGPVNQTCQATQLSWSAQGLPHQIGRADSGGWSANTAQDPAGFLQFGPYTTQVSAGAHTAVWNLMIDNNTADNSRVVRLEAFDATTNTVLAYREVARREWNAAFQYQPFTLPFTLDSSRVGHLLEFRVYWYRSAYVRELNLLLDPSCQPVQQRWSAQSLSHQIGRADSGGWSANTAQDPAGFLQFGPYTTQVSAGAHTAIWNLMIDNNSANNQAIVRLEAFDATTQTLLASREVARTEWTSTFQYQAFALPFAVDSTRVGHQFEFRVYWYRAAYVRQQSLNLD